MISEPPAIVSAKDIEQSLQFYQSLLGFKLAYRWPLQGRLEYAFLRSRGIDVWIVSEETAERLCRTTWWRSDSVRLGLDMKVDDVNAMVGDLGRKGVNPVSTADIRQPVMGRTAVFKDPDGNLICIQAKQASSY